MRFRRRRAARQAIAMRWDLLDIEADTLRELLAQCKASNPSFVSQLDQAQAGFREAFERYGIELDDASVFLAIVAVGTFSMCLTNTAITQGIHPSIAGWVSTLAGYFQVQLLDIVQPV